MTTPKQPICRESNMELLRIVSMLFVLVVHFDGATVGLPQPHGNLSDLSARDVWCLAVESLAIVGVNCFTLISGYFGIRTSWRSASAFLFQCLFYAVGIATVLHLLRPDAVTAEMWLQSWMILSHTDLWYVPAYFGLMLLAPLLNAGCRHITTKNLLGFTALFAAFNIWCGWWWKGNFNPTGYTLVQLVLLYLIGTCLRRVDSRLPGLRASGCIWIAATAGIFGTSLYLDSVTAFAYNSPFVVSSSAAMFCMFAAMKFKSTVVNYIARSSFAVYLIHKQPQVWGGVLKPLMLKVWTTTGLGGYTCAMLGMCAVMFAIAMATDAARRRLWLKLQTLLTPLTKSIIKRTF